MSFVCSLAPPQSILRQVSPSNPQFCSRFHQACTRNSSLPKLIAFVAILAILERFSSVLEGVIVLYVFDYPQIRRDVFIVESSGQKRRFWKWLGQQRKKAGKSCFGTRPSRSQRWPFERKQLQRFVGRALCLRQPQRKGSLSLSLVGSPRSPRRRQKG